jgi:TolB-like protein
MPAAGQASPPTPGLSSPSATAWERLKRHKVLQWTLAYAAAGYTLLHATQMLAESFEWPHLVVRVVTLVLVTGVPIVVLLAWYHGHKGQHRFSTAELSLLTVLLIIAGSILWAMTRTSANRAEAVPEPGAPRTSIAVVPFANLTGDPSKEYFSDGMAEELIDALAQVPGLKVPARTSSFAYKGRNTDIRRIAQDLRVGTILEGSVRSAGERIRVTAQLVDAASGYHLWSKSYDRQFADVFKLQDELASSILQALRGTVPMPQQAADRTAPTQDTEAYRLYLQAQGTAAASLSNYRAALSLYDQAIARDPHFAQPLAGRATLRYSALTLGFSLPNALEDSERDARQALALDARLPEAHLALALTSMVKGNWLEAEASYRRALNTQPRDARILSGYAVGLLTDAGHLQEAHARMAEAYGLAPADAVTVFRYAIVASVTGLDAEATRLGALAVTLGVSPTAPLMTQFYVNAALRAGRYDEAANRAADGVPAALREVGGVEAFRLAYLAMGDSNRVPAARERLQQLMRNAWDHIDAPSKQLLIEVLARLGAIDQAFDLANRMLDEYMRAGWNGGAWGALWIPETRPLRTDPRFQALVARLKLVDYWKQYGPPDGCDLQGDSIACP